MTTTARRVGTGFFRAAFGALIASILVSSTALQAQERRHAVQLDLEGALGVATAEYIIDGIEDAQDQGASLVIIRMDTPGGLVEPMRDIVQAILASSVPVATFVSPGGARADSAGTYILLACHIAAMVPTSHLGAATPVSLGGEGPGAPPGQRPPADEQPKTQEGEDGESPAEHEESEQPAPGSAMERKVMNDAVAYIRSLAERHGRNADWAERAVRDAATLTAPEALDQNVIDLIATDRSELLSAIHGREVTINNQPFVLDTEGLEVEVVEPGWRTKVLSTIASPEIALLLVLIGIYGLIFEGYNPGAIVPGVIGVISLLLAAYALQVIPVNYAGLALMIVGIVLIVAEAFVPSFGALGFGGLAAFIFGAIMMFDSGVPGFGISITFVVAFALVTGGLLLLLVSYLVRLQRRGAVSGRGSIVGGTAVAMEDFTGQGKVWMEGESWYAISERPVSENQEVVVRAIDGLTLHVEPLPQQNESKAELPT